MNVYTLQRLLADVSDDKDLLDLHCQLKKTQPTPEKIDHWDAVDIWGRQN